MIVLLVFLSFANAQIPKEPRPDDKAPGYMGVAFNEVANGIQLSSIHDDSPAQQAGLEVNDVIVKYAGKPILEMGSLQTLVYYTPPNSVIPIEVVRGEKSLSIKPRIGYRPADLALFIPQTNPDEDGNDQP